MTGKEEMIRQRAYGIWEEEGQPHGRADDHWHRAALEIEALMPAQPELMLNPVVSADLQPARKAPAAKKAPAKKAAPRSRSETAGEAPKTRRRVAKKA